MRQVDIYLFRLAFGSALAYFDEGSGEVLM